MNIHLFCQCSLKAFQVPDVTASTRDVPGNSTGTSLLSRGCFFTPHVFSSHHGLLLIWVRSCSSSIPLAVAQPGPWLTEILQEAILSRWAPETQDSPTGTSQPLTFNRKIFFMSVQYFTHIHKSPVGTGQGLCSWFTVEGGRRGDTSKGTESEREES